MSVEILSRCVFFSVFLSANTIDKQIIIVYLIDTVDK